MSDKTLHPEQELPSKQVTFDDCEHCHCPECKHKQVCCWCDFAEREFDEGPEPDQV